MQSRKSRVKSVAPDSLVFSRDELERIRCQTTVAQLVYEEEMPSTNDRALKLAGEASTKTPLLVLCDRQTAGRGRRSNRWWSAPGALTFSLIVDVDPITRDRNCISLTSLIAALSVVETLRTLAPEQRFGLKWPNDVQIGGRKVAGILVETIAKPRRRAILGVGINVNNSLREAPLELRDSAASLIDVLSGSRDRTALLMALLQRLQENMQQFAAGNLDLVGRWQSSCVLTGERIRVHTPAESIAGICHGINAQGMLLVATPSEVRAVASATVEKVG